MMAFSGSQVVLVLCVLSSAGVHAAEQSTAEAVALPRAHAHNDYRHPRPLHDALDHGFCSVEADVFLVDAKLLVGHDRSELTPERTLQALYLDPLRRRIKQNGGRVYRGGPTFTLLIDIKSDAEKTYAALRDVLIRYRDLLTRVRDGAPKAGAVTVVISGNRPQATIVADSPRYAAIDGRLSDLDTDMPSHLMPLISDRWGSHFSWYGSGLMPEQQRKKLKAIVARAHGAGRRVRFWATPEKTAVWKELHAAGVDLINTDDLDGLQRFLLQPAVREKGR